MILQNKKGFKVMKDILIAVIPSVLTLIGVIVTVVVSHKTTRADMQQQSDLTLYRIKELEKKQDMHNSLIERMYNVEQKCVVLDERIKVANHRLDDLEDAAQHN